jgi:hypothetical protein
MDVSKKNVGNYTWNCILKIEGKFPNNLSPILRDSN